MVTRRPEGAEISDKWTLVAHEVALTDRAYHGVSSEVRPLPEKNARVSGYSVTFLFRWRIANIEHGR